MFLDLNNNQKGLAPRQKCFNGKIGDSCRIDVKRTRRTNRVLVFGAGFTLVETLIYVAIIGVVVSSFISFGVSISSSRNKTYVVEEVQANARVALEILGRTIRSASGVNIPTSSFDTDPGILSLIMNDSSKNPTIIKLDQDNGVLQIQEGLNPPVAVTSNEVKISNLVFSNFSSGNRENIGIDMTVEYSNNLNVDFTYSKSLKTSVSIRH